MADNVKFYVGSEYTLLTDSSKFSTATCYTYNATRKCFIPAAEFVSGSTYVKNSNLVSAAANKGNVYFATHSSGDNGTIYYDNGSKLIKMNGNSDYANVAELAYTDSLGHNIASTYVSSVTNGTAAANVGKKFDITVTKGNNSSTTVTIPAATASAAGLVTTEAQTFAGAKTFNDNISLAANKTVTASKFIGALQGNADTASSATTAAGADKLNTSVSLQTDLGKSGTVSFDGSGNVNLGITGTLPVGNGGTGVTATTVGGVAYGKTASTYGFTAVGTAGQVLQSNGSNAPTWITATNSNTASTIVKRDASGNFSAGTITAALSGNATSADKVNHTLIIPGMGSGVSFDGSSNVSVTADSMRTALGLSTAMHFIGIATVNVETGSTTDPKITNYTTKQAGDVILVNKAASGASAYYAEYVWTGSKWEALGDPDSYAATAQSKITAAINALDVSTTANTTKYVSNVNQTDGKISVTFTEFSPAIAFSDLTSTPKVTITVGGNSGNCNVQKADTSNYGFTKLTNSISDSTTTAITPNAVKGFKDTVDAALTFSSANVSTKGTLSVASSATITNDLTISNGIIKITKGANSTHSTDNTASIVTNGGISAAGTVSSAKVRIDNSSVSGVTASTRAGCEMIYNNTQKCLEFTFV